METFHVVEFAAQAVMTFDQFAASHGASRQNFGDAGLHTRIHMSNAAHRRAVQGQVARDGQLQRRRDALRVDFRALLAAGTVREPTSAEALAWTADGPSDRPSTLAARRVLEKRRARAAVLHSSAPQLALDL